MRAIRIGVAFFLAVAPRLVAADGAPWQLPAADDCGGVAIATGDRVGFAQLETLRPLLPPEFWAERATFFFEGMQLEIGPCFRRYAPPPFFSAATQAFTGQARLKKDGGLAEVPAGLPFDPGALDVADPKLGQKWAWNAERRYRGAGRFGDIRLTYVDAGRPTVRIVGHHFVAQLLGRADLADSDYRLPWARKQRWVAGGKTRDPSSGARCAFRHYRRVDDEGRDSRADDLFFFSSAMRRPSRVGWDSEFPLLTCAHERGYYLARGGKVGRYDWTLADVVDLVAPINARTVAYPEDPKRSFGPSGASLANDRWDLRRVLVLQVEGGGGFRIRRYVDVETLFPLYHVEEYGSARILMQYAGRWSEDRDDYPHWPEDAERPVRSIDPVVRVMVDVGGGEVVRIEAWDTVSVQRDAGSLRRLVSQSALAREH